MIKSMFPLKKLVLAALFLALGLMLPFLTGPALGSIFLPMHLPILLCGLILGGPWGLFIGFLCPLLRSLLFYAPPLYPAALSMAFELAAYGFVSGILYQKVFQHNTAGIYASLIPAMLAGRLIWGMVRWMMMALGTEFSLSLFLAGGFTTALPGIVLQLVLIPVIVLALQKSELIP